ncbi:MAG: GntR family transcriptional regulator [Firmicutes bacterium]|nr:GntR family transcriptional regulator [Bacillota bacterium]
MDNGMVGFHDRRMLYLQVKDFILDQIERGVFKEGELIPAERELAESLKISRYTVRRALQELVDEDYLYRVQGSGTFVKERNNNAAKRSDSIGIVMPFWDAETEMMLLSGMQKALRETEYSMTLFTSDNDSGKEIEGVRRLKDEGVAGLIIMPSEDPHGGKAALQLKKEGFPFVLVDRRVGGCITDCVMSDNIQGGYSATKHLVELGHRKIAFLRHENDQTSSIRDRFKGYEEAMSDHGLKDSLMFSYDYRDGLSKLGEFLAQRKYTAVVTGNGVVARDVVRKCREQDVAIPDELSVVSFDDLSILKMLDIALTTVTQHSEAMGAKAVHLLVDQINNRSGELRYYAQYYYPTQLVKRNSCKKLVR